MAKDDAEKKKEKKEDEVIVVVYKVNLHCRECARQIQKPLRKRKGVEKVDADIESGEIKVTGKFESKEIHTLIQKLSKKKVEITSSKTIKVEVKETEKVVVNTTMIKVPMHCEKCEYDLRRKIQKIKGVKSVTTSRETQICTVESTIEQDKVVEYIRKTTRKHVEMIVIKEDKKKEKEIIKKVDEDVQKDKGSKGKEEKSAGEDGKSRDHEEPKININEIPVVPNYFIYCTHASELFSDENPNACFVM